MNISPTQISKVRRCERLIGFEYVEGRRPPATDKQEFGTKVHKQLERWLREGIKPDDSPPGKTALQGIQKGWLPPPDVKLLIEHEIKYSWNSSVNIKGFIDCVRPPTFDSEKTLIIDHKSTSDLRWAMDVEQLKTDPQALLYAIWAMLTYDVSKVWARWVYYAASNSPGRPRKPRGAKPVESCFDVADADFLDSVRALDLDIRHVANIRTHEMKGLELAPNPRGCEMFGGCFFKDICNLEPNERIDAYFS